MTSNYEPPKIFQVLKDINAKNVIASAKPHALHSSVVQNNQNYHHNMGFPCDAKEKGIFNLVFPQMITSAINETTGQDGVSKGYPFFGKVYGNYEEAVQAVYKEIDEILRVGRPNPDSFTPEDYKELYLQSMVKKGKPLTLLEEEYSREVENCLKVFNADVFRHLLLKILIEDELLKDTRGTALKEAMIMLKKCYCDSMDSKENVELKKTILLGVGIEANQLKTPTASFVTDILEYEKYGTDHRSLAGLVNYTKSPQIHFKLMCSVPKQGSEPRKNAIIMSQTGQILWTSIYDYQNNPLGKTPVSTYAQVDRFIYRAGDTKRGKNMFEILQSITTTAPTVYWEKKKGVFQFKATVLKIFDTYEMSGFTRSLSNEESQRDLQEAREAMAYYNRTKVEPPPLEPNDYEGHDENLYTGYNGQSKRDRDTSDQDQQYLDEMINEDYELNQSVMKKVRD